MKVWRWGEKKNKKTVIASLELMLKNAVMFQKECAKNLSSASPTSDMLKYVHDYCSVKLFGLGEEVLSS